MFKLFNKFLYDKITSPVDGVSFALTEVKDEIFASKALGEGVAIKPTGNIIYAPIDGRIIMIAESKHAIGLLGENGVELMIHVGLNTVCLLGKGFTLLKNMDDEVRMGEALLQLDLDFMKQRHVDLTTMVIVTNPKQYEIIISPYGEVSPYSTVMEIKA